MEYAANVLTLARAEALTITILGACIAFGFYLRRQSRILRALKCVATRPAASSTPRGSLTLMTHNLWLHYFVAAPYRAARVKVFLSNLKNASSRPDVVVLQETFLLRLGPIVLFSYVKMLIEGMRELGYEWWSDPCITLPKFFGQNSGLLIFSRLPFRGVFQDVFKFSNEALNNKGLLCARIDLGSDRSMLVIGTHLDSRKPATRLMQLAQITTTMRLARRSATEPAIITGDLNITSDGSSEYTSLCAEFMPLKNATEDAPRFRSFRRKPWHVSMFIEQILGPLWRSRWPSGYEALSLDHVFYTGMRLTRVELVNWFSREKGVYLPVSDHLGVLVDMTVPAREG